MSEIMNRKHIYYFLHGDARSNVQDSFMYLTVYDAVRAGFLTTDIGFHLFSNRLFCQFHDKSCSKGNVNWFYSLYNHGLSKKDKYVLYFHQWYPAIKNVPYFNWLKDNYDVKLVLIIQNPILNKRYPYVNGNTLEELKGVFDIIVTDEKEDALKFGIRYQPDTFCIPHDVYEERESDLFFAGTDKNRLDLLSDISKQSYDNGVKSDIRVIGSRVKNRYLNSSKNFMSYKDILINDLKTNCILEILQDSQKSYTTRFQEAVCLNKKLLTNNKNVVEEKYYNPNYIKVFDSLEDIDWDFVKSREKIDYKYEGDFSPIEFIKKIDEELK